VIKIAKNKTILIKEENNQKIANVKFADTFFSRLKGLMFKKDLDYVLVLKPNKINNKRSSAMHTCFMRINIDIVFLDENKKVFEIATLKPWKLHTPKKEASYILEMREGSIKKYEIAIGDKLNFVCEFR